MVCWFLLVLLLLPHAVHSATRLGLNYTQEELAIWQSRASLGPYRVAGDASPNSPGDWTRILANANNFVADSDQDRFAGQPTATCWSPNDASPAKPGSRSDGEKLRDAGFVFRVTGTTSYRDAVLTELLAQAATAGTQWVTPRWCTSPPIASGHSWEIAMWLTKLIYGYDYIRSSISVGNRSTLDAWFLAAGTFWEIISRYEPADRFPNRTSGDYTTMGGGWTPTTMTNTHCAYGPCITHYGGFTKVNFHEAWNNRAAQQLRVGFLVGVMLDKPLLVAAGKRWVEEWLRFAVFQDNTTAEFHRWTTEDPCLGWYYSGFQVGTMATIADVLARYNGDTSLYTMTTTQGFGSQTPTGGPKSLRGVITQLMRYVDGTITRYGTNVAGNDGNPAYRMRSACTGLSGATFPTFGGIMDTFFAPANLFYQDPYVTSVYRRTASGAPAYPSNPSTGGYGIWGGEWGTLAGVLFQAGGLEGVVLPYGAAELLPPDVTTALRMHLKFDAGTGTTAADSTVNNHFGTLQNGATWGAPTMGTSALLLDGVDDQVTVSGLLTTPAALTLAAWVLPSTYGTGGAEVVSVGNVATLRVTATQVLAHYWNGTTFTALSANRPAGGGWQHVAYTVTAGTQKLYVNGSNVASGSAGSALSYTGQGANTLIGTHGNAGTTTRFGGLIDDVRVYTRALSSTDIAGLAALEDPPPLSIQILTPTTGDSYSTSVAMLTTLGGTARDDTGVTGVTWNCPTCTPTSGPATCSPTCGAATEEVTWTIPSITFPVAGTHHITVTATDASGTRPDTLTVTYTPPPVVGGAPCTHYASPAGGGDGSSQGQPFKVVNFWAVATPGKVLCLVDGTYTDGNSMINVPPSFAGTASKPITIRALNDGKVHISGGTSNPAILLGQWGVLEGVNLSGQSAGTPQTLKLGGNDWVVRRVVAWNNTPSGPATLGYIVSTSGYRNVLEDCAAWGHARYVMNYSSALKDHGYNIIRRCWIRHEGSPEMGHQVGIILGYNGHSAVTVENVIATQSRLATSHDSSGEAPIHISTTQDSKLIGVINYNLPNTRYEAGSLFTSFPGGDPPPLGYPFTARNLLQDMVSFASPGKSVRAFDLFAAAGTANVAQNLVGIGTTVGGCQSAGWSGCTTQIKNFATLATAQSGLGGTVWEKVPGICKRVINGTLTTQPLWSGPGGTWPMNQRIMDALALSNVGLLGGPTNQRTIVDVTATMQSLLGPIPAARKTDAVAETCTPPRVGTPPTCNCPTGTVEPLCEPEITITCPPDCPVQDVFVIATTGSPGPAGSDASGVPCTLEAPCATINRARSLMTPTDTLYLRGGTYTGAGNRITTSTGAFPAGNSPSAPTKIAGYAGETVILQQTTGAVITLDNPTTDRYLVFDNLTCDGASGPANNTVCFNILNGVHHIRLQNLVLRNTHFRGIFLSSVNNIDLVNTTIHGATHSEEVVRIDGASDGILLDGVTMHSNNAHGLQTFGSGVTNLTVRNSIARNNVGTGFVVGATNLLATNLLAHQNALGVRLTSAAVASKLYHATMADNTGTEVQIDAGAQGTLLTNVLAVGGIVNNGTGTVETTNLYTDPGFIGAGNYHLALATSPAIDAGTCLPGVVDVALDGAPRPQPPGGACDIGAYEQAGSEDPMIPTPGPLSARPGPRLLLQPQ